MNKELIQQRLDQALNNVSFVKKEKRSEFIERGKRIEIRLTECKPESELEIVEIKYEVLSLESDLETSSFWRKVIIFTSYVVIVLLYPIAYIIVNEVVIEEYLSYVISSVILLSKGFLANTV